MSVTNTYLERAVVGAVLSDLSLMEIVGQTSPRCFADPKLRKLWELLVEYSAGDDPADLLCFYDWLRCRGQHVGPGQMANLCELIEGHITTKPIVVTRYIDKLLVMARRRRAAAIATRIADHVEAGEDAGLLVEKLARAVATIEEASGLSTAKKELS